MQVELPLKLLQRKFSNSFPQKEDIQKSKRNLKKKIYNHRYLNKTASLYLPRKTFAALFLESSPKFISPHFFYAPLINSDPSGNQLATCSSRDCMSMTMSDHDTNLAGECQRTMRLLEMQRRTHYDLVQVQTFTGYLSYFSLLIQQIENLQFFHQRQKN